VKAFLVVPIRRTGNKVGHITEEDKQEVHQETRPYQEFGFVEPPNLDDTVVHDIRNGKDQNPGRNIKRTEHDLLRGQKIGRNETHTKQYPHQHEGYTDCFFFHIILFFKRLPSEVRLPDEPKGCARVFVA
jgi:hypothetical protein